MIRFVHQDLKFVKRLETLYKEEKKAVIAAGKAKLEKKTSQVQMSLWLHRPHERTAVCG